MMDVQQLVLSAGKRWFIVMIWVTTSSCKIKKVAITLLFGPNTWDSFKMIQHIIIILTIDSYIFGHGFVVTTLRLSKNVIDMVFTRYFRNRNFLVRGNPSRTVPLSLGVVCKTSVFLVYWLHRAVICMNWTLDVSTSKLIKNTLVALFYTNMF